MELREKRSECSTASAPSACNLYREIAVAGNRVAVKGNSSRLEFQIEHEREKEWKGNKKGRREKERMDRNKSNESIVVFLIRFERFIIEICMRRYKSCS